MEFGFKVKNNRLVSEQFPEGLNSLCAVVDASGSLMQYGEEDKVKAYYMRLLDMYHKINSKDYMKKVNSVGASNTSINKELLFIDFSKLDLPLKYKCEFMNYMINASVNGRKIKQLVEGTKEDLIKFLDDF